MFLDNFMPSTAAPNGSGASTITMAPTGSSSSAKIPPGGTVIELNNTGTVAVFIEFGAGSATATVPSSTAGSYPVYPGQCKLIRRPIVGGSSGTYADTIAAITASATGAISISVGEGN